MGKYSQAPGSRLLTLLQSMPPGSPCPEIRAWRVTEVPDENMSESDVDW